MRNKSFLLKALLTAVAGFLLVAAPEGKAAAQRPAALIDSHADGNRDVRQMEVLKEEVRHQLVMLPYYSVFDWLQAEVRPDGSVTLMGEVTRPTTKDDAEARVKKLEGATRVTNDIEVLPLSPMDDQLRLALYRSVFGGGQLLRYATQSVPPIHIIVKNGHATLKGVVANETDSQIAYMRANQVPGVFEVNNQLQIEQRVDERISSK
jgi:hyperosmotically inducible protein